MLPKDDVTPAAAPTVMAVAPAHDQVGLFWDIENCRVPSGRSTLELVKRFRKFFLTESAKEAEFMCVCDTSKEDTVDDLYNAEVLVIYAPATNKNAADDKLRELMRKFAETHTESATVVLISGDVNFRAVLSDIQHRYKHKVILVHPEAIHDSLRTCVEHLVPFSHFTKDLPPRPTAAPLGGDHILVVHGLPRNREKKQIETRLLQLSENSGRCRVNVLGDTAHMRFSSPSSASRAKVRMEGEDVFGRKISIEVLPVQSHYSEPTKDCSPQQPGSQSSSPRKMRNRRKREQKKSLLNKGPPDGGVNGVSSSPPQQKTLGQLPVSHESTPSPPLEPYHLQYSSDGTTTSPETSPFRHKQHKESQPNPPISRYSTPSPPTLRGSIPKRPASPHILYSQLRERSHSPFGGVWDGTLNGSVGKTFDGPQECAILSEVSHSRFLRQRSGTPDRSHWKQRLRHNSGDLYHSNHVKAYSDGHYGRFSPSQNRASARQNNMPHSRGDSRRSRSWSSYSNHNPHSGMDEVPGKNRQQAVPMNSPLPTGPPFTDQERSVYLSVSNLDVSFTASKWVEVLEDQFHRQNMQIFGVKTETQPDGSIIGYVQVPSLEAAKEAISSLHRKKIRKKRIHVCVKHDTSAIDAKLKVIAILSEVSGGCLPLLEFVELFEKKCLHRISMSELSQMEDTVRIEESECGRMVTFIQDDKATEMRTQALDVRVFPDIFNKMRSQESVECADLCPAVGTGDHVATSHDNPHLTVMVPLKILAAHVHTMLQQHNGNMPLKGFLSCYEEHFGSISCTKDMRGVPLEHLLTAVPGIKVTETSSGVKDIRWLAGNSADANTEILEHFSAHRLSQVTKDLVHLLENATGYTATVSGLQDMYRQNFDRPFRAEDYDCENLLDVLKAIPNHVQVLGWDGCHSVMFPPAVLARRFRTDLLQVLQVQANKQISLANLEAAYRTVKGKPFDVTMYGVCYFNDLHKELPQTTTLIEVKGGMTWVLHLLEDQVAQVLLSMPDHQVPVSEFLGAFKHFTGHSVSLQDYKVSSVCELMTLIPETAVVKCQNGSNIISLANVSQDWHHRQRITLIREGPGLGMTVAELCDIYKKVYGKDISKTEVSAYIHHSLKKMPNGEGLDSWTTLPKEPFNITNVKEPLNAVSKTGSEAECLRSTGLDSNQDEQISTTGEDIIRSPSWDAPTLATPLGAIWNGEVTQIDQHVGQTPSRVKDQGAYNQSNVPVNGHQLSVSQLLGLDHQDDGVRSATTGPDPQGSLKLCEKHTAKEATPLSTERFSPDLQAAPPGVSLGNDAPGQCVSGIVLVDRKSSTESSSTDSSPRSPLRSEHEWDLASSPPTGTALALKKQAKCYHSQTTSESSCSPLGSPVHGQGTPQTSRRSRIAARFSNPVHSASPTPSDISI